jgi:hypothetical protein
LAGIQADAIAKLDLVLEQYREGGRDAMYARGGGGGGIMMDDAVFAEAGSAPNQAGPEPPTSAAGDADGDGDWGGDATSGTDEAASDPTGGSDTNVQVEGVDEADFVKVIADRTRIYVLHGNQLFAVASWPPSATSLVGTPTEIEGSPIEMFVHEGKAVVFSTVYDYSGELVVVDDEAGDREMRCDAWDCYGGRQFVKITQLNLAGESPTVERELYYEASYTSSRRYGDAVRVILQADRRHRGLFFPDIEWRDAWGREYSDAEIDSQLREWRARTVASIRATTLDDWLTPAFTRVDGELQPLERACGSYYVPVAGLTDYGLTHVLSLDMADAAAAPGGASIMGWSSIVYSNLGSLVLAQPDYRWIDGMDWGAIHEQQTALHLFEIDGANTTYTASGWVPGHPQNQFAIDEREGTIRVSTTGWERVEPAASWGTEDFWRTTSVNRVLAVQARGGKLAVVGTTGPIGEVDETIRSTRFIGDRGYVVTFRQTDPLFVIDLSNPEALEVLGTLHIPGFSEYMHPLGDDHLLTIGRDATDEGRQLGLMLQIFDVSDDTAPELAHRHVFADSTYSEASYNHKAFTFYAAQDLLAFPMSSRDRGFQSTLQLFRVNTETGFESLGAVDHTDLFPTECTYHDEVADWFYYGCHYSPDVRRGMFINDDSNTFVYTLSYAGLTVHNLGELDVALASVSLPVPSFSDGRHVEPGWDGAEPSVGVDAGVPEEDPPPPPAEEPRPEPDGGV